MKWLRQYIDQSMIGCGEHQLSFVSRVGEDTLGDAPAVGVLVKEEFVLIGCWGCGDNQKVEIVEDFLLLCPPVIIVEVVLNPHESLVDHLWRDVLLQPR